MNNHNKSSPSSSSNNLQTNKQPPTPKEDTPLLGLSKKPLSSQPKTFANVFIAVVGAGVLGLPYAFKRIGWIMSLLMLFSVSVLTYYCMMLLVYTRRKLDSQNRGLSKEIVSFGDLGFVVCGSIGRFVVDILIVLSQDGFCVGYLIYIGDSLTNLFNSSSTLSSSLRSKILGVSAKSLYIWGCFPFQLGLNSIPTLTHLAPLSIFADIVDLGAMAVVMVEDTMIFLKERPELHAFGSLFLFFWHRFESETKRIASPPVISFEKNSRRPILSLTKLYKIGNTVYKIVISLLDRSGADGGEGDRDGRVGGGGAGSWRQWLHSLLSRPGDEMKKNIN